MSDRRISFGYYSVGISNPSGAVPCADIDAVADALPHGSGLDTDYAISVSRDGNLAIRTEFHAMDEHGFYRGWRPVTVRLYRERVERRHPLNKPGFYQITGAAGDVNMSVRCCNDLADYLHDAFYYALRGFLTNGAHNLCYGPTGRHARFGADGWEECDTINGRNV